MAASLDDAIRAANRPIKGDETDDRYRRRREANQAANREIGYRHNNLEAERYGGFRELTIVCELQPACQVFGPYGADVVRLIERSKHLTALELERLAIAQRCPYPVSASTRSVDQAESWWATNCASDVIEEAAYEAGRRGAKQTAGLDAFMAYNGAVEALVMKDVIAEECFEFLCRAWREVIDQQTNPGAE